MGEACASAACQEVGYRFIPNVYVEDIPLGRRHAQLGLEIGGHLTVGHLDDDGWGSVFAVLAVRPDGPVDVELERRVAHAEELGASDSTAPSAAPSAARSTAPSAARSTAPSAARSTEVIEAWREVLAYSPGHALAHHRLEVLLEQEEDWLGLVELLRARITHHPEASHALSLQIASVLEHDLQDHEQAIATYEGLLGLHDADPAALAALSRLYGQAGDWSSVVEIERTWLGTLASPRDRSERLLRIARIARDELDRPDESIAALREVIALVPDHARAMDELADLYASREEWWPLVEVLTARALLPGAGSGQIQLRLAHIMEDKLGDDAQAIRLYESALEAGGDSPTALGALERLYLEASDWAQVAATYERQLDLATSPATRADLLERTALVREEGQGDLEGAMLAWDRLLEIDPDNQVAFEALKRLQGLVGAE